MLIPRSAKAKQSLLRELDRSFQQYFHTNLREVVDDLRVHYTEIALDPAPDEIIRVIDQSKILEFVDAPRFVELRDTIQRVRDGQFGVCVACKRRIPERVLVVEPNSRLCGTCALRVAQAEPS